jgi:chromosome partitioning protein
VSDLPPDVVARGRAIFERLRGSVNDDVAERSVADETPLDPAPPAIEDREPPAPAPAEEEPDPPPPALELVAEPPAVVDDVLPTDGEPTSDPAPSAMPAGRFARPLPRVLAVANQKGGVGKTTTAVNLAATLAEIGYRVLVVDLDPQGNASTGLGINIRDLATSMYDDADIEDCIEPTSVRGLFVAPANLDLAGAEIELVPAFSRELKLRAALDDVRNDYDFVLIDCPPSLGLLTVNSLAAAGEASASSRRA